MSALFEPFTIGARTAKNRVVRSGTYECRADAGGEVTPELLKFYETLGQGNLGTVVTGLMHVSQEGKSAPHAVGIDRDELIPGLGNLASAIKTDGTLAIFQIAHAGGQAMKRVTGSRPRGPSDGPRNPLTMEKSSSLSPEEIPQVVADFARAAGRAQAAGADGVQIHAAHGYLLSSFLSPFFNRRTDAYGGSEEGRYRMLGEIIAAVRKAAPELLVLVKMNLDDGTPEPGMTPELAASYAARMAADGVDCLEVSAGATMWAPFVLCRGEAHTGDFARAVPWPLSALMNRRLGATQQPLFEEAYNAPLADGIKAALGPVPLAVVGGMRTRAVMEECLASGAADLISVCRPLIREPNLMRRLATEPDAEPTCISCSRCLAACFNDLPIRCYVKGLPAKGKTSQA